MRLTTSPEREALVESAGRVVRERYDYAALREALASAEGFSRSRWRELAALGWLSAVIGEDAGGLGLPLSAAGALATALGPAAASEPWSSQIALGGYVLDRAGGDELRDAVLACWQSGEALTALADDEPDGQRGEPQPAAPVTRFEPRGDGGVLHGRKHAVIDGAAAGYLIVSAAHHSRPDTVELFLVDAGEAGVERAAHRACDGRLLADVTLAGARVAASGRLACDARRVIEEARTFHALLLAAESLGIMQQLVRLTYEHLAQREQFGRRLAEFQVLQHRLVDMHLATVRTESSVDLACLKCDELGLQAAAPFVSAAKVEAGLSGRHVGQEAIQMHGAIGMTEELVIGHYLKRLVANELLAGSTHMHLERRARSLEGLST